MRIPETHWHDVALENNVLRNLEYYAEENAKPLRKLAVKCQECLDGETPEMLATHLGSILHNRSTNKNLCTPIEEDVTGKEGRKLALGFVGTKALETAQEADEEASEEITGQG